MTGVAAWRLRMATPEAMTIYNAAHVANSPTPSCAISTSTGCSCGRRKVETWMAGFALTMNILTEAKLRAAQTA
jgi:hypothetical protein